MPTLTIVGIGPGAVKYLTVEARDALLSANKIFFRTGSYPACQWLKEHGKHVVCFDILYDVPIGAGGLKYELMAEALIKESENRGTACYALPGNPGILEDTTRYLRRLAAGKGIDLRVIPGVSFLDVICAELDIDALGMQIVLPRNHLEAGRFTSKLALMVCQVDPVVTLASLLPSYPPHHTVTVIWTRGMPDYALESKRILLKDLTSEFTDAMFFASLYVPPAAGV